MSRQKIWTDDEIARAVEMRAQGMTFGAIAATMPGRTEGAVGNKINNAKRPREIIRAARIARNEALSLWRAIAKAANVEQSVTFAPSERLRVKLILAIDRFANNNGTDIDTAARFLLSGVAFG
jgi:hypothetical protein